MAKFPFKILFVCIFLPPVCYMFSLNALEAYLQKGISQKINEIVIQNDTALYQGRYTVKQEVTRNITDYLADNSFEYKVGISTDILVKTKNNQILYPAQFGNDQYDNGNVKSHEYLDYVDIAAENYKILNEGLIVSVNVRIRQDSWISNTILIFYILLALAVIRLFIKRSIGQTEKIEEERLNAIRKLTEKLNAYEMELTQIKDGEEKYRKDISLLEREKEGLSEDIDELLDEMGNLEKGLSTQKDLREKREKEIKELKIEIDELKIKAEKPKKKNKKHESIDKRFKVLYKNLSFTQKAVDGFISLPEDFQLKAEEIIHRINEDDSKVPIKRKVFSKGGKINVLEVDFSYSGRMYFQKDSTNRTKIIAIGTKKTQDQDLAYLEREFN